MTEPHHKVRYSIDRGAGKPATEPSEIAFAVMPRVGEVVMLQGEPYVVTRIAHFPSQGGRPMILLKHE